MLTGSMLPIHIEGCFGVLHPASGRRGVLICGSMGDEALNSYRSLVFLGEKLAEAGFPTLRLHYHGTGDSAGSDTDPDRFQTWLHDIVAAVGWLRTECCVDAVTVIGLRIGAALAARAATDIDAVDSLALLLPISGRRFLNELTMAAQITQRVWQTSNRVDDGTWFEAHGLRLDRASRDALKALDFSNGSPAPQLLVIDAGENAATRKFIEHLGNHDVTVHHEIHDELGTILRDSYLATIPHATFGRIAAWVGSLHLGTTDSVAAPPSHEGLNAGGGLNFGFASETAVNFGREGGLFGTLCTPAWLRGENPTVLLVNTSANPRYGNARISVEIARRLAMEGIASLRMDASGMGDSAPPTGELGQPYSESAPEDVGQGAAELFRRFDRPVVVLGICSGAYHALQVGFRDARVGGLVLINLQRFVWRDGDPSDAVRRTALRPTRFYLRHILDLASWRRLAFADFDVLNLLRVLALRMAHRLLATVDPLIAPFFGGATRVGRIRRSVTALGLRGVPILYVLGHNDPGIEELAAYFGSAGRILRRQPNVTFRLLSDSDHMLSSARARTLLIDELAGWLRSEFRSRKSETNDLPGAMLQPSHAA
jgi:alpha-beta hydrolase superfamily lysophospholipase